MYERIRRGYDLHVLCMREKERERNTHTWIHRIRTAAATVVSLTCTIEATVTHIRPPCIWLSLSLSVVVAETAAF